MTRRGVLKSLSIQELLKPHRKALSLGLLAVIGESAADLLQPWPLKIVFDNVLKSQSLHGQGWLNNLVLSIASPITIIRRPATCSAG